MGHFTLLRRSNSVISLICALLMTLVFSQTSYAAKLKLHFTVDNIPRTATIYKRDLLKRQRRRVIIVLHGNAGNVAKIHQGLDLERYVGDTGITLVYPQAIHGKWGIDTPQDAQFIRELETRLVRNGTAQAGHIFIAGVSTGGMLAMSLACNYPQAFVGAAAVLANMPTSISASCKPKHVIPFLLINATHDAQMPYDGGPTKKLDYVGTVLPTEKSLIPFATVNGCEGPMSFRLGPMGKSKLRASFGTYKSCKAPLELVKIINGQHVIPGRHVGKRGKLAAGAGSGMSAAKLIFSFSQHLKSVR